MPPQILLPRLPAARSCAEARPILVLRMNPARLSTGRNVFILLVIAVTVLHLGREFFIPLALAVLITFLLAPVVWRLEKWHFGRIGAVLTATALGFLIIGIIGYVVAGQVIDLANDLPKYKSTLREKAAALKMPADGPFSRAFGTLKELSEEINRNEPESTAPRLPATSLKQEPVPVAVIETPGNAFETLKNFGTPLFQPLGTAALVIVFVVFMLIGREDLRDRVIHLIGRGHLQVTTRALNDAGKRVSRYLLAQLIVNTTYGIPVGVGLAIIGVPNAVLWGLLATVLRFIPYLGPWIAATFPILLSLAVAPGWKLPLLTIGLFVVIEIISNNVVEPWLYGSSTGLSPIAIIISAAFWTWLWGITGLLLATPLTVCIVVLGKYIPALSFVDVLFGDKPPIAPEDRFYQRLLAQDEDDICEIAETYAQLHSLTAAFDAVIIPALRLADDDYHAGHLTGPDWRKLLSLIRDLIRDLGDEPPVSSAAGETGAPAAALVSAPRPQPSASGPETESVEPVPTPVFCLPASDEADEVVAGMLAVLLRQQHIAVEVLSVRRLAGETIEQISRAGAKLVCLSVLPPGSTRHAIYYCKLLRDRLSRARLLVGVWGEPAGDDHRLKRITRAQPEAVVLTTMEQAVKEITAYAPITTFPAVAATPNESAGAATPQAVGS